VNVRRQTGPTLVRRWLRPRRLYRHADRHHHQVSGLARRYSTGDWNTSNPVANPTVLDAQRRRRGLSIIATGMQTVTVDGFTITGGDYTGLGNASSNEGGGVYASDCALALLTALWPTISPAASAPVTAAECISARCSPSRAHGSRTRSSSATMRQAQARSMAARCMPWRKLDYSYRNALTISMLDA